MNFVRHWGCALAFASATAACKPSIPSCSCPPVEPPAEFILVDYAPFPGVPAGVAEGARPMPKYEGLRARIKSVAVRAPNECMAELPTRPDDLSKVALSLTVDCRAWILEIQRAFSSAGWAVFPWDVVALREREKNMTTAAAALDLGADVVFTFRRLEISHRHQEAQSRATMRVFASDAFGELLGGKSVDKVTLQGLASFVAAIAGNREQAVPATTLDATAVLPGTGEPLWIYQRTEAARLITPTGVRFLFGRYGNRSWSSVEPLSPPRTISGRDIELDRDHAAVRGGKPMREAEELQLVKNAAQAMVRAFVGAK